MAPAEAIWLGQLSNGTVELSARYNKIHDIPNCIAQQIYTGSASVGPDGALTAKFTRPLVLAPGLAALGYAPIDLTAPMSIIAAWGTNATAAPSAPCAMTWPYHLAVWLGTASFSS